MNWNKDGQGTTALFEGARYWVKRQEGTTRFLIEDEFGAAWGDYATEAEAQDACEAHCNPFQGLRQCGLNADWCVRAWHVGPGAKANETSGDFYILDSERDTYLVVQRFYGKRENDEDGGVVTLGEYHVGADALKAAREFKGRLIGAITELAKPLPLTTVPTDYVATLGAQIGQMRQEIESLRSMLAVCRDEMDDVRVGDERVFANRVTEIDALLAGGAR